MLQEEDSYNVQSIVNKFSSPEKVYHGPGYGSPRWGRNRSLCTRSRHAQRALGVFSSRSFSAGATGASISSTLKGSIATQGSVLGLKRGGTGAAAVDDSVDSCPPSRRLSMGDTRLPKSLLTDKTVRYTLFYQVLSAHVPHQVLEFEVCSACRVARLMLLSVVEKARCHKVQRGQHSLIEMPYSQST